MMLKTPIHRSESYFRLRRLTPVLILAAAFLGRQPVTNAQTQSREFPLTVTRVTNRIIVVATGATPAMPNVTAVRTDDGLVVFDTGMIPSLGKQIRAKIEEEFGTTHIAYLVLTHAAYDHSFGDAAYPDVPIIGHADVPRAIDQYVAGYAREGLVEQFEGTRGRFDEALAGLTLDYQGFDERLAAEESFSSMIQLVRDLAAGARPLKPTITFSDSLTLVHGGLTFKMHQGASVYEVSNIMIEIPEEQTLLLGDELNKERLPWLGRESDIPRLASEMVPYLDGSIPIAHYIPGHGKLMTADEIREHITYAVDLEKALEAAKKEGLSLEEAQEKLRFDAFGHLQHLSRYFYGYPVDGHEGNIRRLWGPVPPPSLDP